MLPLPLLRAAAFVWSALLSLAPLVAPPGLFADDDASPVHAADGARPYDPDPRPSKEPTQVSSRPIGLPAPRPPFPPPADDAPAPDPEPADTPPAPQDAQPPRAAGKPLASRSFTVAFATLHVDVAPGGSDVLLLDLENRENATLAVNLSVNRIDDGWRLHLFRDAVVLPPHGEATVHALLHAPAAAAPGDRGEVIVRAWSLDADRDAFAGARATVAAPDLPEYAARAGLDAARKTVAPGGEVTYQLRVTNLGGRADAFAVVPNGTLPLGWSLTVEVDELQLGPGASEVVPVTLTAPETAADGDTASPLLEVHAHGADSVRRLTAHAVVESDVPAVVPVPDAPACHPAGGGGPPVRLCGPLAGVAVDVP